MRPPASSEAARTRMQSTPRRDTPAEMRIRKLLHAMGLRYSIDAKPLEELPRRADIVFRRAKVAVFVDGCFWHGCPEHGTWPRANDQFWRVKILANKERDSDTNNRLRDRGWLVIRIWEHEDPSVAAMRIKDEVHLRLGMTTRTRNPNP
ncbi:MAG: very short patch repair endonuclease [Proteobacteria bacterium]|nr:very short patch repair endonuclease [Pseudomonadota bacterium]